MDTSGQIEAFAMDKMLGEKLMGFHVLISNNLKRTLSRSAK